MIQKLALPLPAIILNLNVNYPILEGNYKHCQQINDQRRQEYEEVNMIGDANAIINPRAMVVEALDTFITNCAMLRPRSPHDLAIRTKLYWINQLEKFL